MRHGFLCRRALAQRHHDVVALARMERFFLADADHGARIRAIRAAAQGNLVDDGGTVDQPADGAHVGPRQGGIVEDAGIFGFARVQGGQQVIARDAQGFRGAIQVQAMACFILDLRQQDRFAFQGRGARDPVTFRQLADDFRVRVLRNLADQGLAVGVRHPVLGLDLDAFVDARLESAFFLAHVVDGADIFEAGFNHLCVHDVSPMSVICAAAQRDEQIIRYKKRFAYT